MPPPPSNGDSTGPLPELPSSAPRASSATVATDPATYDPAAETDPAALSDFQDTLSPYGSWADDSTYGTVWVPSAGVVGADFAPYVTHGHWGLGADGSWVWVSDFGWGWAPFHYGRWVWIGGRGWAWIPGRVYSPAWVVWQTGYYDDWYVGWAPMPPTWYWHGGAAFSLWFTPPAPYVFCPSRHAFSTQVRTYVVAPSRVGTIAPHMRPYVAGSPSVGPSAGSPSYRAALYTRGPNLAEAHVPTSAVPAQRVMHDTRALAYARPVAAASRTYGPAAPRPAIPQRWQGVGGQSPNAIATPRGQGADVARPVPDAREMPRANAPSNNTPTFRAPAPNLPSNNASSFQSVRPAPQVAPAPAAPRPAFRSAPVFRGGGGFRGGRVR
jgi:hypothetical protein